MKTMFLNRFTKTRIPRLLGGLALMVFLAGCPNDDAAIEDDLPPPPPAAVYLAGSVRITIPDVPEGADPFGARNQACFWVNGTKYDLGEPSSQTSFSAAAIAVSGGKIYIAGTYPNSNGFSQPCLWAADVSNPAGAARYNLPLPGAVDRGGTANAIAVSNNKVYIAGYYEIGSQYTACYWVYDGTRTRTDFPCTSTILQHRAYSITVSEGKVYVGGYYQGPTTSSWNSCWWDDEGKETVLFTSTNARAVLGIAVSEGTVYTMGKDASDRLSYWIDGKQTVLMSGAITPAGFAVSDGKVYTGSNLSYWINGRKYPLDDSLLGRDGTAAGGCITVFNGKLYVGGQFSDPYVLENPYSHTQVCYWVDGKRIDIAGSFTGQVNGIAVTD